MVRKKTNLVTVPCVNFGISDNGLALNRSNPRPVRAIRLRQACSVISRSCCKLDRLPHIRDHRGRLETRLELANIRDTSTAQLNSARPKIKNQSFCPISLSPLYILVFFPFPVSLYFFHSLLRDTLFPFPVNDGYHH